MKLPEKQDNKTLLTLLERYQDALVARESGEEEMEDGTNVRELIEQDTQAVQKIVWQAGCGRIEAITPPSSVGHMMTQHVDPFLFILEDPFGVSMGPAVLEMVEETIELLKKGKLPDGY